jgi:hypothetical protein
MRGIVFLRCFILVLATSLVVPTVVYAAPSAVPSDFDSDGTSDLIVVSVTSGKKLTWTAKLSSTGSSLALGTLGIKGNHLAMAQWQSSGTQIGVVSLVKSSGAIKWTVKLNDGTTQTRTFGKTGDLVVSGGDFNGNGTADAAVARIKDGKVTWDVWYDMFASATEDKQSYTFGENGDRAFFARVGTDGIDWIGVIRKSSATRSLARMRNLVTGEIQQFTGLPKFASNGARPRAFPIRQASGADLLGFQVEGKSSTSIKAYQLNGTIVGSATFDGAGISVVGEFRTSPGYEVKFLGPKDAADFNPAAAEVINVAEVTGTPVDDININTLGAETTTGGGSVTSCASVVRWPSSFIYKIRGSEHFSPGDVRRNTAGLVLKNGAPGPYPTCVDAVSTNGSVVAKLGLYSRGNGWAARYYAGWGCGASTAFGGSQLASRASAASGSSSIYMKLGSTCYGPINASQCVGSSQC